MSNKKAQSALELVILVGAVMLVFITLLLVFQQNLSTKSLEQRNLEVQELALSLQSEIAIAAGASNGYARSFTLPEKVIGKNYDVSIIAQSIYLITEDEQIALSLPIQNTTGQPRIGVNVIQKQNGEILLN